jgi:hypothetical protein
VDPPPPPAPDVQPPADAPPQAAEPAAAVAKAPAAPAAATESSAPGVLAYVLPAAAFLAVAGLIGAFALFSMGRKAQAAKREAKRSERRPAPAAPPVVPSTALREWPDPLRARRAAAADDVLELQDGDYEVVDDVLELGPDELDPIPDALPVARAAERQAPAPAAQDWPKLEL